MRLGTCFFQIECLDGIKGAIELPSRRICTSSGMLTRCLSTRECNLQNWAEELYARLFDVCLSVRPLSSHQLNSLISQSLWRWMAHRIYRLRSQTSYFIASSEVLQVVAANGTSGTLAGPVIIAGRIMFGLCSVLSMRHVFFSYDPNGR